VITRYYPQDTGNRAIAGVFEDGFAEGWGPLIHDAPSYRIMTPSGAFCRLKNPGGRKNAVVQIQLFAHIEHPPLPTLRISCDSHSWVWEIDPGWQVHCRSLHTLKDVIHIDFKVIDADDEPWFELHVTEISILESGDPRIKCKDESSV